jgi:hypothetical protein
VAWDCPLVIGLVGVRAGRLVLWLGLGLGRGWQFRVTLTTPVLSNLATGRCLRSGMRRGCPLQPDSPSCLRSWGQSPPSAGDRPVYPSVRPDKETGLPD